MKRLRLAFVVQRYGLEVNGGAETFCRQFAERMARYHDVEVLTTRAIDYNTWRNEYPAAPATLNGVSIRRFGAERERDSAASRPHALPGAFASPEAEVQWVEGQGPYVPELLRYLEQNRDSYDLFLFQTYLYYTACCGLPKVADRSILIPTAHDELPIYLGIYDTLFGAARLLFCLTPEESGFLRRRFYDLDLKTEVIGTGLDLPPEPAPDPEWERLRVRIGDSPYLLYAGRVDVGKGCGTLLEHFERYAAESPDADLKLVLLGRSGMELPDNPRIVVAGFVPESTKFHAMRNCRLLVVPSARESLCIAALEAWQVGKPVLVNADCAVLRGQCQRSNGGLWYSDYEEFREALHVLLGDGGGTAVQLGAQGRAWVESNYLWEHFDGKVLPLLSWAAACAKTGDWTATA